MTTTDPLVSISGSPYGYVGGDPLNVTDPTGLFPPLLIAFAVGALIEGGIELATQAARNTARGCGPLDNIDWGNVAQAAAIGGLTRGTSRYLRAAKTATHSVPIGPGSEKAWTVLNRVDAKGAPLPGYRGGRVFENSAGKLPENSGVTYREWDVNPYAKGVKRGTERVVTGSDGSAYWTGDHYGTFLMFRGPTG
ncbi:MAG: ribonuclease domain-containing protein [Dermatophilaceae bacterium]